MKNNSARVPPAAAAATGAPEGSTDAARGTGSKLVRLNLALKPEVASVLKGYAERNNVTVTETIRRALSVLDFVAEIQDSDEQHLAVGRDNVYRDVLFRW